MSFREEMDFDLNRQISRHTAFLIILVLSFLVALYSVTAARRLMDNMQNSAIVHIEKRDKVEDKDLKKIDTKSKPVVPKPNIKP